mmetsp:Transcript_28317/g.40471  ORF Transcript_28317/g.40471 Transcript_28317/m.40471 type:complete len:358 (+) Transcript_28317:189-1262(+)
MMQNLSYEDGEESIDSNFDIEIPTITNTGSVDALATVTSLGSIKYDATTIRNEFKTYQEILPHPDVLLQEQHSFTYLRNKIEESGIEIPRFLKYKFEGGVKPHTALCCLLLGEYETELKKQQERSSKKDKKKQTKKQMNNYEDHSWGIYSFIVRILSFGYLHIQINNPADYIRDQFFRVAHVIPTNVVPSHILRKKIKNKGLPVPNYFLDPDDPRQFPPHIALLVMLQDGEQESRKLDSFLNRFVFSSFALISLLLRIVLEVIGGAGAIWGGAEVVKLRNADNADLWRWLSISVGLLCFARFVTLNAPYKEDEGDILGPAGPWSLRLSSRLRAVCDHPFHYFVRALPPSTPRRRKVD